MINQEEKTKTKPMKESMKWYAVRTMNNKEKSVLEKLTTELKYNGLEDRMSKCIIPTEKFAQVKNDKKILREKVVYPGYIFIETSAVGEISNFLKGINGAAGFVRTRSGEILPMKDSEIKKILNEQEESNKVDIIEQHVVGETVEITYGPFTSFKGKISLVDKDKDRVKVDVNIFGRPTSTDLSLSQIKKVSE